MAQFWYDFAIGAPKKLPVDVLGSKDLRSNMLSVGLAPLRVECANVTSWEALTLGAMSGRTEIVWAQREIKTQNVTFANTGCGIFLNGQIINNGRPVYYFTYGSGSSRGYRTLYRRDAVGQTELFSATTPYADLATTRTTRVIRDGSVFRFRTWVAPNTEPSTWDKDVVDGTYSGGYYGLLIQPYGGAFDFLYVAVGTDGDSPPTGPVPRAPNLSGNAKKANGEAVGSVLILDWVDRFIVATATPDANGNWSAYAPPGQYGVIYLADGCAPVCHGPYTVLAP